MWEILLSLLILLGHGCQSPPQNMCASDFLLNASSVPKFVSVLNGPPPVYVPDTPGSNNYTVWMTEITQQILPSPFPTTRVYAYAGRARIFGQSTPAFVASSPGPTFETIQNVEVSIKWINNLSCPHMFPVDPALHWANPNMVPKPSRGSYPPFPPGFPEAQADIPTVPHLHGAEVYSGYDGHPEAWFTWDGKHGPKYDSSMPTEANSAVYRYTNQDDVCTMWYHDHALGITRLNVAAGLAGFYIVRSPSDLLARDYLPSGIYDVPLVIQDRVFNKDGSICFKSNTDGNGYWVGSYSGNVILVNGKAWPQLKVDRGVYMFRILDGSNARRYNMTLISDRTQQVVPFQIIAIEGGYLRSAVLLSNYFIAPGMRITILVDFSGFEAGDTITMRNLASDADVGLTDSLMQFKVSSATGYPRKLLPKFLEPRLENFPSRPGSQDAPERKVLAGTRLPDGSFLLLVNGQLWDSPPGSIYQNNKTVDVEFINTSGGFHPMHIHLNTFQIVSRTPFNDTEYMAAWLALNGKPPFANSVPQSLDPAPFFIGPSIASPPEEHGYTDMVRVYPGQVVRIRIHFGPQQLGDDDDWPFNVYGGPQYVEHCHIVDHEDNEMMIPMFVRSPNCQRSIYKDCLSGNETPCCNPEERCARHSQTTCFGNHSALERFLCIPKPLHRHHM